MNIPNFGTAEAKNKIKNLRSTYIQELVKIKKSEHSGMGIQELYNPKVTWFEVMHSFMKIVDKKRESYNNMESKSNASQVVLRHVGFSLSGNISCEVTVEKKFITAIASMQMSVVDLPEKPPVIKTNKDKYKQNDTLIANCTSSPSVPSASLSFLLNNTPVGSPGTKIFQTENNKQWSLLSLNITLSKEYFTRGNQLILKCTALVSNNRQTTELHIPPNTNEPIPERVRSYGSNGTLQNRFNPFILALYIILSTFSETCK